MAGKMSIAELKKQLELCLPEELLQWEEVLKKDERIGVQKIGFSLEKKADAGRKGKTANFANEGTGKFATSKRLSLCWRS